MKFGLHTTHHSFGHAEGAKVASRMFSQMKDDGIPMGKLIALARDGPNVNKTILNELQQMIKDDYPQFVGFAEIGSCVLHVVHYAFGKGLEKNGKEVDQLCLDLHAIFKQSAARREDYQQLQFDIGVELHTFQQHTDWYVGLVLVLLFLVLWNSGMLYASLSEILERIRKQHLRAATTNGWQQCLKKEKRVQLKFCFNF